MACSCYELHYFTCSTLTSSLDMKCPAHSRCWYCKDLCENCLSPAGFGLGLTAQSEPGIPLKFCSQECSQYFTGSEVRPFLLDIEILPPGRQHDSKPNVLVHVTGSGMLKKDEGVKVTCLICHGYYSEEHANGRFFILCQLRSLFSQKVIEMFVSEKAVPVEPLPHADCSPGHKMVSSLKASETVKCIMVSAIQRFQDFIHTELKEETELGLNIFMKFQGHLFKSDQDSHKITESIKVSESLLRWRV